MNYDFRLACCLVFLAPAPGTAETPGEAVNLVRNFSEAVDDDEQAAESLLAGDALIGIGHIGSDDVVEFVRLIHSFCELQTIVRATDLPPDVPVGAEIVEAHYLCVRPEPRDPGMTITYYVTDGRIAGGYAAFADDVEAESE